jgi:hypothetical protein
MSKAVLPEVAQNPEACSEEVHGPLKDIYRRLEALAATGKVAESVLLSLRRYSAGKPGPPKA